MKIDTTEWEDKLKNLTIHLLRSDQKNFHILNFV